MLKALIVFAVLSLPTLLAEPLPRAENVSTPFNPCVGDKRKDPIQMRVKNCHSLPCKLPKGSTQEIEVDFEVEEDVEDMQVVVLADALGMNINFPVPEKNACKSLLNAECPLDKGEEITYNLKMEILKEYPNLDLGLELSVLDAEQKVLVCFKFTAAVVDGL